VNYEKKQKGVPFYETQCISILSCRHARHELWSRHWQVAILSLLVGGCRAYSFHYNATFSAALESTASHSVGVGTRGRATLCRRVMIQLNRAAAIAIRTTSG